MKHTLFVTMPSLLCFVSTLTKPSSSISRVRKPHGMRRVQSKLQPLARRKSMHSLWSPPLLLMGPFADAGYLHWSKLQIPSNPFFPWLQWCHWLQFLYVALSDIRSLSFGGTAMSVSKGWWIRWRWGSWRVHWYIVVRHCNRWWEEGGKECQKCEIDREERPCAAMCHDVSRRRTKNAMWLPLKMVPAITSMCATLSMLQILNQHRVTWCNDAATWVGGVRGLSWGDGGMGRGDDGLLGGPHSVDKHASQYCT